MATPLKRRVVRKCERPTKHNGKRLVVILEPGDVIGMREEGRRITYRGSLERVYWMLAKWHADEMIRAKREAKKQRKLLREQA
jgi:hypothetical protein